MFLNVVNVKLKCTFAITNSNRKRSCKYKENVHLLGSLAQLV